MKVIKQIIASTIPLSILLTSTSLNVLAVDITNKNGERIDYTESDESITSGAPVIGEFKYDEELAKLVETKERITKEYWEAIDNSDYDLASKIASESNGIISNNIDPTRSQPTFKILSSLGQRPQETGFWCGYAAIESLLDYDYQDTNQTTIANAVWSPYYSCPWYMTNGANSTDFPVVNYINPLIGFTYVPYPYGAAGATTITAYEASWRVRNTICNDHGLLVCGKSDASYSATSHFPNYPTYMDVEHWVAIDGYSNSGDTIHIVDPAKSPYVSWSANISAYYNVSSSKLAAYASFRGIIW